MLTCWVVVMYVADSSVQVRGARNVYIILLLKHPGNNQLNDRGKDRCIILKWIVFLSVQQCTHGS